MQKSFVFTGLNKENRSKYSSKGYEIERLSVLVYVRRWEAVISREAGGGSRHRPRWAKGPRKQKVRFRTKVETDIAFQKQTAALTAQYGKPLAYKILPKR